MLKSFSGVMAASMFACGFASVPAYADETDPPPAITVTGNVALVTDYRFRGLSQSNGDPAIQGGININHASGFYVGVWSSSLDFSQFPAIDDVYGEQELDVFGGWTGSVGGGVTADVGLLYYAYPGGHTGNAEFFEPYASLSTTLGPATAKLGVAYAWSQKGLDINADGNNDDNLYVYMDLGAGIPDTPVSLSGHIGYTDGALSPKFATGATTGYSSGWDYSLGATYSVTKNLSLGVSYVGVDGATVDGYSDDTVIGTLKLSF